MVFLDGEVIMGVAVYDYIVGNLVLGQQGVASNILALNIYCIK